MWTPAPACIMRVSRGCEKCHFRFNLSYRYFDQNERIMTKCGQFVEIEPSDIIQPPAKRFRSNHHATDDIASISEAAYETSVVDNSTGKHVPQTGVPCIFQYCSGIPCEDDGDALDDSTLLEDFDDEDAGSLPVETLQWIDAPILISQYLKACPSLWSQNLDEFVAGQDFISPSQHANMESTLAEHNDEFISKEVSISGRNGHHLIRSSGSLAAPLLIKLHYPSFTTSCPNDGETADHSSPCPRLLMHTGLTSHNAFWMQAYYRRELPEANRKSPMRTWSERLLQIHEDHSQWHEDHSTARFRLLLGAHNRVHDLAKENIVTFTAQFPESVTIKSSLHIRNGKIHHIAFYATHPEYLFRNPSRQVSLEYDVCLGLVAALAKIDDFRYGYFLRRAEYLELKGVTGRELGDNALHDAIQLLAKERLGGRLLPLEEIPLSLRNWLSVEHGTTKAELDTLLKDGHSVVEFCHQKLVSKGGTVKAQLEKGRGLTIPSGLDKIRQANREKDSQVQRYQVKSSTVTVVRVHCAKCKSVASEYDDTNPTFEKGTGKYISRKRSACNNCCVTYTTKSGSSRKRDMDFIPVDTSTLFVYARNISAKK